MVIEDLKKDLNLYINQQKAEFLPHFFKTGKGQYAEGDKFLGIIVSDQRKIAKKYFRKINLNNVWKLLDSEYHEHRLTAIFILYLKFENSYKKYFNGNREQAQKEIVELYLKALEANKVNNWDLVDSSAHYILGKYLFDKDRSLLYDFARSDNLWKQRAGIISTFYFIKQQDFDDALSISEILLNHKHDLIHKAVGWMLREIGNRNLMAEEVFLNKYYKQMPRTMLRYAIEKFVENKRQKYLKGLV